MSNELIYKLVDLSKTDTTIARIIAERKKLEGDAVKQKNHYLEFQKSVNEKQKKYESKKQEYLKEEKYIKEEREKIINRRKGLASLNNYKVQQAAEKELDAAMREIQLKEESLIPVVDQMDQLEKESIAAQQDLKELKSKVEAFLSEAKETMPSLDERQKRQTATRMELAPKVNPAFMAIYDKVRSKYPIDAVVPLNDQNGCSACNMNAGPQIIQKLMKAESIEKCPGCGRIVYVSIEKSNELQQ